MSALVLLHPAMTGRDAHEWCQRHAQDLQVEHRQGKVHLIVVAQPRAPASLPGALFTCGACGWAGMDPGLIPDLNYHTGYVPVCPRCDAPYPTLKRSP